MIYNINEWTFDGYKIKRYQLFVWFVSKACFTIILNEGWLKYLIMSMTFLHVTLISTLVNIIIFDFLTVSYSSCFPNSCKWATFPFFEICWVFSLFTQLRLNMSQLHKRCCCCLAESIYLLYLTKRPPQAKAYARKTDGQNVEYYTISYMITQVRRVCLC